MTNIPHNSKFFSLIIAFAFPCYAVFQLALLNTLSPSLLSFFPQHMSLVSGLSTTYLLTDAVFILPAGILLDHFPLRQLLPIALCLIVLGLIILLLHNNISLLYISRLITGIGHAFAFLAGFKIIRHTLAKKHQAFAMSSMVASAMLGGVLAQTPAAWILDNMGWYPLILSNILFGIILLTISLYSFKNFYDNNLVGRFSLDKFLVDIIDSIKFSPAISCGFLLGLFSIPILLFGSAFNNLFIVHLFHVSNLQATTVSSAIFIGNMIGMPIAGWIADKTKKLLATIKIGACMALCAAIALLVFPLSFYLTLLLFFLISFGCGVQTLGYVLISQHSNNDSPNTSMAIANVVLLLTNAIISFTLSLPTIQQTTTRSLSSTLTSLIWLLPISLAAILLLLPLIKKQLRSKAVAADH